MMARKRHLLLPAALVFLNLSFASACAARPAKTPNAASSHPSTTSAKRTRKVRAMEPMFRPLSFFKDVARYDFPDADRLIAAVPPSHMWPTPGGGAGRTHRCAEPLLRDHYKVAWQAALGEAEQPDHVLLANERLAVLGAEQTDVFDGSGRRVGTLRRGYGSVFWDLAGQRLLAPESGRRAIFSRDGTFEAALRLVGPSRGYVSEILQGPGALTIVTIDSPPHGAESAVVETVHIRDYAQIKNSTLYGVEPLAGITREKDARVVAAAGKRGPVLATVDGVEWRDWQLKLLQGVVTDGSPEAIAADEAERVYLLVSRSGIGHLQVFAPNGDTLVELDLPHEDGPFSAPLLVASSGQVHVTSEHKVLAISPAGKVLWRADLTQPRALTLSANGILLVGGDTLDAITPEGKRITLWRPPAPITTPPVLAGGRIYVATREHLYALAP
jgi:hypothetical protein